MKKLLFAAAALVFTVALSAQEKFDDHVKFKVAEYDFGKIKLGTPVTVDFLLTNIGKTPVVFESATATCGCTTPVKPEKPVMPGAEDKLTAGFNAGAVGPFTKPITIKIAGVDEVKTIVIKGEVLTTEAYEQYVKTKSKENKETKPQQN